MRFFMDGKEIDTLGHSCPVPWSDPEEGPSELRGWFVQSLIGPGLPPIGSRILVHNDTEEFMAVVDRISPVYPTRAAKISWRSVGGPWSVDGLKLLKTY